jgi:hypothetical protein
MPMANAVINEDTGASLEYRHIIQDETTFTVWNKAAAMAKELSQNQPDFFPEYLCCYYQDFCQGFALSQNYGNKMQNVTRSYTLALNGNTRTVQHISTVNHWLRDVVYHVSVEYTAFTTGREPIKKLR